MLALLDGDKVIAKYGENAQKVADFAPPRLEWDELLDLTTTDAATKAAPQKARDRR
jgi:hypothetical protein